jgi:hypothetical protein
MQNRNDQESVASTIHAFKHKANPEKGSRGFHAVTDLFGPFLNDKTDNFLALT